MNNFVAGWVAAFIFNLLFFSFVGFPKVKEDGRVEMRAEAVKKGFGQYIIEEKEIVFKWNDAILEK